jgi:hypothetical protein
MMKSINVVIRIIVAGFAYVFGLSAMSALAPMLRLPTFKTIPGMIPQHAFALMVLASPLLIIGLLPLAAHLKGNWLQRCAAVGALLYVTLGLNTLIESKVFTDILEGSPWRASLQWILPSVLTAAAITYHFGDRQDATSALGRFAHVFSGWRVAVAWLVWPVIYFVFGACVAPIVMRYYQPGTGALGLHIPAMSVIIRTQLLRSAFFLAASLPAIVLWTRSRGYLIFALGLAHAVTVGIFQLAQASFLPMVMRAAHSIEITCDSFAYAAVLVLLFVRAVKPARPAIQGSAAAAD